MDPVKIIVTNSDNTSTTSSNTLYQLAPNSSDSSAGKPHQNASKAKLNRQNLPPLKLNSGDHRHFSYTRNEDEQSEEDDSKKLLLGPVLSKSFMSSQSSTSLNSGKKIKIQPSSAPRLQNGSGKTTTDQSVREQSIRGNLLKYSARISSWKCFSQFIPIHCIICSNNNDVPILTLL